MSACESVDLPDPFGPMSAWTSPEFSSRSTPCRISFPATLTWRSPTFRTLIFPALGGKPPGRSGPARCSAGYPPPDAHSWGHDLHVVAVDDHLVDGDRHGRGKGLRFTGLERE